MNLHNHTIKVMNFANCETVTYCMIKIIGTIENEDTPLCQKVIRKVYLKLNDIDFNVAEVIDGKFKILVELIEGLNHLELSYCCETTEMNLNFFPRETDYCVVPLYVICDGHDGQFQAPSQVNNSISSACDRITLCAKLLQCVTAEKLYEHNLGRKTFHLKESCEIFNSSLNYLQARQMKAEKLWEYLGREIMNSEIGDEKKKYLAFLSCTFYCADKYVDSMKTHIDLINITEAYVALGGGGLALFGTACLFTWPECYGEIMSRFEDTTPIERTKFLDDSCYRGTYGSCFSTTLGYALHELYHTFDLGHTESGIMGRGFDNIYKVFTLNVEELQKSHSQDISKTFQSNIEFKEEFEPEKLSERLEKENKKKEFSITRKFDEMDCTFLNKSCAVLLSYHKWFNNVTKDVRNLTYDPSSKFIKSINGIRVIQIRDEDREFVLDNWTFEGKVLKFSFQLPAELFLKPSRKSVILVVEDTIGNILKETITF